MRVNVRHTTFISANESEDTQDDLPTQENIIDIQPANEEIITLAEEPVNLQVEGTSHEKSSINDISVTQKHTSEQTNTESVYPLVTCMAKSAAIVLGNVPEVQKVDQKRVRSISIVKKTDSKALLKEWNINF
jgi:hypothetical protein